jgi:hypothetical protein
MMKISLIFTQDDAKKLATKALEVTCIAGKDFEVVDVKWERYENSVTFELESREYPNIEELSK